MVTPISAGNDCVKCTGGGVPEGPCWVQDDCTKYCDHWDCWTPIGTYECKNAREGTKRCPSNSCDAIAVCLRLKGTVSVAELINAVESFVETLKDEDPTGLIDEVDDAIDASLAWLIDQLGVESAFDGLVPTWNVFSVEELDRMIQYYEDNLDDINNNLNGVVEDMESSLTDLVTLVGSEAYDAFLADYTCSAVEEKLTILAEAYLDEAFQSFRAEVIADAAEDQIETAVLGTKLGQKAQTLQTRIAEFKAAYEDPYGAALARFEDNSGCPGASTASVGEGGE